jgi:hypothetical protein
MKASLIRNWRDTLNQTNGIVIDDSSICRAKIQYYRYTIGKGNNPGVIAKCMKSRWWWIPNKDPA